MSPDPVAGPRPASVADYARPFAALAGAVLVTLGLVGILARPILGSLADVPIEVAGPLHDLSHLVAGALFLHVAFALPLPHQANGLLVLGAYSLAFSLLTILSPDLFGLLGERVGWLDQVMHLGIGSVSLVIGWLERTGRPLGVPRRGQPERDA